MWFRSDLRLDDNDALTSAATQCSSVLPVYCFDPRDYGRSPQGYDRTGPYRASFLIQAVQDLRNRLQSLGSELVVRIGNPEEVVAELARKVGASTVYCHSEVTYEEQQVEKRVEEGLKAAGAQLKLFWTNTLHAIDDLPFALADMPQSFDAFRASMALITPRSAMPCPDRLQGMPVGSRPVVPVGDIPTLKDLGLHHPVSSSSSCSSEGAALDTNKCIGGETEGLKQMRFFLTSASGTSTSSASGSSHANSFSTNIAPWLATGCLSPRRMLQEAQAVFNTTGTTTTDTRTKSSLQWIEFELLWRDFFRLLTRKHAEVVLPKIRQAALKAPANHELTLA